MDVKGKNQTPAFREKSSGLTRPLLQQTEGHVSHEGAV